MSAFITTSDYNASIHTEILNAITRNDAVVLELAEDQAISEMRGYMHDRYDIDAIFNTTGTNRNMVVFMFAIDITLYHLHSAHNPMHFPQIRKDRYDRAMEWLSQLQRSVISPDLPLRVDSDGNKGSATGMNLTSNTKRVNQY